MNERPKDYLAIASRHCVDLADVQPQPAVDRLAILKETLARTDVPYPIRVQQQATCLAAATAGEPFGIGQLGSRSIDLKNYASHQVYDHYTFEDHLSWACLVAEQQHTKQDFACQEYLEGERLFEIDGGVIPDFYLLNARIYQQTRWQLATVSMIIPAELFFTCHSRRFFPVTTFMRPLEVDYLEEPDIGHDVAGHVATFTIPAVANVMKNHGRARDMIYAECDQLLTSIEPSDSLARERAKQAADYLLTIAGRIYWFTVEFGLVLQAGKFRCFGAGILSSPGETKFSVLDPQPNRILIDPSNDRDLLRLASTDYLINTYQQTYFVLKSFDLLNSMTPERILAISKTAATLPDFTWREIVPGDQVANVGTNAMSVNEKYFRLIAGQSLDECLHRTAIKNLKLAADGINPTGLDSFNPSPPAIPPEAIEWFRENQEGRDVMEN